MIHAPRFLLLGALSIFACGAGLAETEEFEIFTCRDVDGNVSLQNDPCPVIEKEVVAPPTKPVTTKPTPKPTTPERVTTSAPEPVRRRTVSWTRVPPAPAMPERRSFAKQTFATSLNGSAPSAKAGFHSPEQTWRTFLAALDSGDHNAAAECLTAPAREKLAAGSGEFPLEELRSLVGSFVRIEDEGHLGPYWSISASRTDRRPKWIFFERSDAGEWKISAI